MNVRIATVVLLALFSFGSCGDEDDGLDTSLAAALARVKTREIQRLLQTSWCVVTGPSCRSRLLQRFRNTSQRHNTTVSDSIDEFSRCICSASDIADECHVNAGLQLNNVDHINVHTSFSLVFYWVNLVKDFFCFVSDDSSLTCDYSQRLIIPVRSRNQIHRFAEQKQRQIASKSACGEFCGQFRCVYEGWNIALHNNVTSHSVKDDCSQHYCKKITPVRATPTPTADVSEVKEPDLTPVAVTKSTSDTTDTLTDVPMKTVDPDAAEQDGDDLGKGHTTSSLVGGLIGGLLAIFLVVLLGLFVLVWKRKQKRKGKQDVPIVTFSSPFYNPGSFTQTDQGVHITAINPLAVEETPRPPSIPDVICNTSKCDLSFDDTYATLNEIEMQIDRANEKDGSLSKGTQLVVEGMASGKSFYPETLYDAPVVRGSKTEASTSHYLEPVDREERYVKYPPQYLEPMRKPQSDEEYLEPVPINSQSSPSEYLPMSNELSHSNAKPDSEEAAGYENFGLQDDNYYNM